MNSNKIAFQYGVIATLCITLFNVFLIVFNPEYAFGFITTLFYVIMILAMIIAIKKVKAEDENYISFKSAFTIIFIISFIVAFGNLIFSNLIQPIILPNYLEVMKSVKLKSFDYWAKFFNIPQEVKDKTQDEIIKGFDEVKKVTIGGQMIALIITILLNTFSGSVIALFMKSKGEKPKEMEAEVEHPVS